MAGKAAPKKKVEEEVEEKKVKEPLLFQPIGPKGDYPALVIYAYPNDVNIGIIEKEGAGMKGGGGWYGHSFQSMIHGIDRCLFAYKINNTQKSNLRVDEFLELLREHKDLMENFMAGEVKKCRSKL